MATISTATTKELRTERRRLWCCFAMELSFHYDDWSRDGGASWWSIATEINKDGESRRRSLTITEHGNGGYNLDGAITMASFDSDSRRGKDKGGKGAISALDYGGGARTEEKLEGETQSRCGKWCSRRRKEAGIAS
ncbi:hypothetical protein Bca4012_065476 [Brassica carinata]|uniref:Uncharacterized protein n=1 Tax=Brassica carinata TaxID=52824 RepID=A0A8X8AVR6_BRACI|nr:hypothetical protein Bca52824_017801 [Brassica carinata]